MLILLCILDFGMLVSVSVFVSGFFLVIIQVVVVGLDAHYI